ncbi:hypothetical protein [Methylobacterium sp. J-077]|uniref:hypothetical protein n=1 Tax=Methylobacterium sp. J-077 TaxID=2836656 RepID=UPI001FBA7452|nr:hypothetical protein [Methylobacterium sp. J-077]MCJ2121617.1 hypothetical protein [Methylobacterium sp. J-077]
MPLRDLIGRAGFCALLFAAAPALAADFDGPPPPHGYGGPVDGYERERRPPPPPPELEFRRPRFTAAPPEACREFVRRRFDPDGAPVVRRVRVCDEAAFERGPPPPPPPPPEDGPPRPWGGPRW